MPLPPALAAKLAKRGIAIKKNKRKHNANEEVFAENYDNDDATIDNTRRNMNVSGQFTDNGDDIIIHKTSKCPNKNNAFHKCATFCFTTYGDVEWTPKPEDERKRIKLMKKYPLSADWVEVCEPTVGRCYYWNIDTDLVSWMPPGHAKFRARISLDKMKVRELEALPLPSAAPVMTMTSAFERFTEEDLEHREKLMESKKVKNDRESNEKLRRDRKKRDKAKDELDPMDPAAYSDIARGDWRSGLDEGGAKSGVDSTATGPLFQARPYPSPGDILRRQNPA